MSRRERRRLLALAAGQGIEHLDRVLDDIRDAAARQERAVADLRRELGETHGH